MVYRRKPLEIEAIQFTRAAWDEVVKFTNGKASNVTQERCPNGKCYCWLDLDSGNVKVFEGEYITKDEYGGLCVWLQFPFESTFEPVPSEPDSGEDNNGEPNVEGGNDMNIIEE